MALKGDWFQIVERVIIIGSKYAFQIQPCTPLQSIQPEAVNDRKKKNKQKKNQKSNSGAF